MVCVLHMAIIKVWFCCHTVGLVMYWTGGLGFGFLRSGYGYDSTNESGLDMVCLLQKALGFRIKFRVLIRY